MNESSFFFEVKHKEFSYIIEGTCWCKWTKDEDGIYMEYYDFDTSDVTKMDMCLNYGTLEFEQLPKEVQDNTDTFVRNLLKTHG